MILNLRAKLWLVEKRYHDVSTPILVSTTKRGGMKESTARALLERQKREILRGNRRATLALVLCDKEDNVVKREKGEVVDPGLVPELWGVMSGDKLVMDPRALGPDHWSRFTNGRAALQYTRQVLRKVDADLQPVRVR